jgi:excinuclease ABC subunit B
MKFTIDTTTDRRAKQEAHNKEHGITPTTTIRELDANLKQEEHGELYSKAEKLDKMPKAERQKIVAELKAKMLAAAKNLEFEEAARLRDQISKIKNI